MGTDLLETCQTHHREAGYGVLQGTLNYTIRCGWHSKSESGDSSGAFQTPTQQSRAAEIFRSTAYRPLSEREVQLGALILWIFEKKRNTCTAEEEA